MQTTRESYPPTTHVCGRQTGQLDLSLERVGTTTRPVRSEARPPLQLSRVRYDTIEQPGTAAFTLVHLGGVLDGDSYELRVALGLGASASVATAAATQVYRMPHGAARQDITLRQAAGSRLAWLPEPLILCAGARFTQTTRIELAPGALLGSLYMLGDGVDADYWCARINQCDPRTIAGTLLPNGSGLLVRMLGATSSAVHTQLRNLWSQINKQIECKGGPDDSTTTSGDRR